MQIIGYCQRTSFATPMLMISKEYEEIHRLWFNWKHPMLANLRTSSSSSWTFKFHYLYSVIQITYRGTCNIFTNRIHNRRTTPLPPISSKGALNTVSPCRIELQTASLMASVLSSKLQISSKLSQQERSSTTGEGFNGDSFLLHVSCIRWPNSCTTY